MLKPFWRYYGGKYRAAPRYPRPRYDTIVEPFAGAAGYSLRYPDRQVILIEKYHVIAEIWRYLISADPKEILATPSDIESLNDLPDWTPQGLCWLIGFCLNSATASPCKTLSAGRKKLRAAGCNFEGWSVGQRERVASQVPALRHWTVIEGSYQDAPDVEATWFVDPPYQTAGVYYKHSSRELDFPALGDWCRSRRGQVIACEAEGADWLPFQRFGSIKSFGAAGAKQKSGEVIWCSRLLDAVECRGGL